MQLSNLKFDLPAPGKYNDENAFQLEMNFHRNSPQPVFIVQLGGILLLTKPNSMQVISTWGVVILRSIWSSWFEQKLRCFITEKRAERSLVQPILYRLMHVFEWLPIILKSLVNVKWQMTIFFLVSICFRKLLWWKSFGLVKAFSCILLKSQVLEIGSWNFVFDSLDFGIWKSMIPSNQQILIF